MSIIGYSLCLHVHLRFYSFIVINQCNYLSVYQIYSYISLFNLLIDWHESGEVIITLSLTLTAFILYFSFVITPSFLCQCFSLRFLRSPYFTATKLLISIKRVIYRNFGMKTWNGSHFVCHVRSRMFRVIYV